MPCTGPGRGGAQRVLWHWKVSWKCQDSCLPKFLQDTTSQGFSVSELNTVSRNTHPSQNLPVQTYPIRTCENQQFISSLGDSGVIEKSENHCFVLRPSLLSMITFSGNSHLHSSFQGPIRIIRLSSSCHVWGLIFLVRKKKSEGLRPRWLYSWDKGKPWACDPSSAVPGCTTLGRVLTLSDFISLAGPLLTHSGSLADTRFSHLSFLSNSS